MHDIEIRSRLRVHYGDVWPVRRFYAIVGGVYDRPTLFSSHCRAYIQSLRAETDVHGLRSARRVDAVVSRLLYR